MSTTTRPTARLGRSIAATLALVVAVLGLSALPAAADDAAWSVAPADTEQGEGRPNYGYEVEPGDVVEDALAVTNTGDVELTLAVAAADGYTTATGVLDLLPVTDPQSDVGAWVVPAISELTLSPGEGAEVPFTLTVPRDAAPGDHTGGIVTIRTAEGSGTVQLEQRLGTRIHVRVPGEQQVGVSVTDAGLEQPVALAPWATSTATISYTLANTGNVRTVTTERVTLSGPGGVGRVEQVVTGEEILPGSAVVRTIEVSGTRPLGWTVVDIEVVPQAVDGELGTAVSAAADGWAVPWSALGVLVLLVGLAITVGVVRARRAEQAEPTSPAGVPVP